MKGDKILKAGLGYTIGNFFIKGLAFLTLPIFTRIMSTEDFGIYNIFIAYEGIFLYLVGYGLETSFKNARFKYGKKGENTSSHLCYEEYVSTMSILAIGIAAVWLALFLVFHRQATALLGLDLPSILLLIVFSLSNAVVLYYNAHVSINYEYKKYVALGVINAVGSVVLSIVLIKGVFIDRPYLGRMIGATSVIFALAIFVLVHFIKEQHPGHFREYSRWGLRYCLPIIPHGISQTVLASFDRIMIGHMIGKSEAGIYSFAYNVFAIVYVIYRSLDPVWSTWFFEKMNENKYSDIRRYSGFYIMLMFTVSSAVILFSPEFVYILGSSDYKEAVYCVIPIVAGGFFTFMYSIPCQVEYYREKTNFIAVGTTSAAIINIALNYIFIRKYGYIAAAYTTLATYVLYFLFHFAMAYQIEKKQLFSVAIISLCSAGVLLVSAFSLFFVNALLIRGAFAAALVLIVGGYLVKENKELIMALVKKRR